MPSQVTSEQLSCLIEDSNDVVSTDHLIEMHCHFIVIHLIAHYKVSVLKQKSDAQEHEERVAAAELVRGWQRTLS